MALNSLRKWGWHSHLLVLLSAHTPHPQCKDYRNGPPCDYMWTQSILTNVKNLANQATAPARSSFQEKKHTAAVATLVVGSAIGAITADPKHEVPELAGWGIKSWADLRCSPIWPNQRQGLERRHSYNCEDDGPSEAALSSLHRLHRPTPQREASDQQCPGCVIRNKW